MAKAFLVISRFSLQPIRIAFFTVATSIKNLSCSNVKEFTKVFTKFTKILLQCLLCI